MKRWWEKWMSVKTTCDGEHVKEGMCLLGRRWTKGQGVNTRKHPLAPSLTIIMSSLEIIGPLEKNTYQHSATGFL